MPMPEVRDGLLARLQRMDRFGLFLVGFILAYAATSMVVEFGLGVIGFAKTPYLNGLTYIYSLGFIAVGIVLNQVTFRFAVPHPYALLLMAVLFISVVIGIANHNATPYIIAWTLYMLTGILAFQFFRNPRGEISVDQALRMIFSLPMLLIVLVFTFTSIFKKDNDYQYVLVEVMALYAMLMRPRLIEKFLGLVIYGLVHLGSQDEYIGVAIELNRASILAVGTIWVIYLLYRRWLILLLFSIFAVIGVLNFAVSLDDDVVQDLPRNVREAIQIMKGDPVYNHVSSYERVYEGIKVMEDYDTAGDAEWLFGMGLGRTVDMTAAADKTPGQHALLGATEVHNIHFINYAAFHKFGLAGLALLTALGIGLIWMFAVDLGTGRLNDASMFLYFYLFYNFVFAFPASNFLIANPLWPAFLGVLCWMRARQTKAINRVALPALTEPAISGRT